MERTNHKYFLINSQLDNIIYWCHQILIEANDYKKNKKEEYRINVTKMASRLSIKISQFRQFDFEDFQKNEFIQISRFIDSLEDEIDKIIFQNNSDEFYDPTNAIEMAVNDFNNSIGDEG
jgi:hypothetical protein